MFFFSFFCSQFWKYESLLFQNDFCIAFVNRAMTAIRVGVLADLDASVNAVRDRQAQLDADGSFI